MRYAPQTYWLVLLTAAIVVMPRPSLAQTATPEVFARAYDDLLVSVTGQAPTYSVRIGRPGLESPRNVELPNLANSIVDVRRWSERLVVFGMVGHVSAVYVIDLTTYTVVDMFIGERASPSPDGRFVAYSRADPRTEPDGAVYLVYDVSRSTAANRMTTTSGMAAMRECGMAVFPLWNTSTRQYDPEPAPQPPHDLRSTFGWLDPTTFAFVDYSVPTAKAILVSLLNGVANPEVRVQALVADEILDRKKLELPDEVALGSAIYASDVVPIRSTSTTWVFEIVIKGGSYVKQWTVDVEM
jgi:hypothetical protein